MNWTTFLLTLTLVYLAYYGLNLLYDLLLVRRPPKSDSTGEVLVFDEDVRPEIIEPEDDPVPEHEPAPDPPVPKESDAAPVRPASPPPISLHGPIRSTGAVGLKELFDLAKDNLIEHTRAIPY